MKMIGKTLILAISCTAFFDTLLPPRPFKRKWVKYTSVPAFWTIFLIIAVTRIPPYPLQPVRLAVLLSLVVFLYYRADILKNLTASVTFCGIYWIATLLILSAISAFPSDQSAFLVERAEAIIGCIHLFFILLFRLSCQSRLPVLTEEHRAGFGVFSLSGLILMVSTAMTSWDGSVQEGRARLASILSFIAICACLLYFIASLLKKEKEVQSLRLIHERTLSQMSRYHSMQKSYEQQRRHLHDYKNQLNCIQGMLEAGKSSEALKYISTLTGNIRKSVEYVNTNHDVVNMILNQKYQEAVEKGITLSMTVNDLSALSISEEQIVALLGNLLDNAIEACERLNPDLAKIIHFKMVLEEGQLILSTRNPVKEPVQIRNNRIRTRKSHADQHGIGLLNVDSVIRTHNGASVLKCENGWFSFSAMIPLP